MVAHDHVDVRGVDHRGAACVSDEAPLHQRRAAAVSGGTRQRRGPRCAVYRCRGRRNVQGTRARIHGAVRRDLPGPRQRRLDDPAPVQDPAHGQVGRHEGAVDLSRAARLVLLRRGREGDRIHSDDPRHRHPSARAAAHPGCGDARRRRPDGHRGGNELPAGRVHQFRHSRADHDPGRRYRGAGRV